MTRAQPSGRPLTSGSRPPLDHPRAPGEARSERRQHDVHARREHSALACVRERDRERARRRVAVALDAVDHALGVDLEPLADRGEDAGVGLVVDEQADVVELEADVAPIAARSSRTARQRLTSTFMHSWVRASEEDAGVLARAIVRLCMSYVSMPPEADHDVARDLARLMTPFAERYGVIESD